jgi:hypothetical protein
MVVKNFIEILQSIKSDLLFNPYTDRCVLDKPDAPEIRKENLKKGIESKV